MFHCPRCISFDSYIKPQRLKIPGALLASCISFDSYIKPQPPVYEEVQHEVVYLLIPTSNHNKETLNVSLSSVVYLLIPTSNHNQSSAALMQGRVVYLLIPTSNHNTLSRYDRR